MGWKDFFGKKKEEDQSVDPLADLTLSNMKQGYFVDYDLRTWEVTARHYYDWGDGDITDEWQLKSHDDTIYLQKESDDDEEWCISRPIAFGKLGAGVRNHLSSHDDPPDEIDYEGETYYMEEFGGGYFYKNSTGAGQQFLSWSYENDAGSKYLSVEQWGEEDFEAFASEPVEEYQFTNILPRE